MTDREIMRGVEHDLHSLIDALSKEAPIDRQEIRSQLMELCEEIHRVTTSAVDYQVVVDNLDDNILIANAQEEILYVNPAYERNSRIDKKSCVRKTMM